MIACAMIAAALASAAPGAVIAASGTCEAPLVLRGMHLRGVALDARAAAFPAGALIRNVSGLKMWGGTWGRADRDIAAWHTISVEAVADFSLAEAKVVGNGDARGSGILVVASQRVTIRDNQFIGHATAIGVRASSDALVARNRIEASTADGINLTDNQRVIAAANECHAFVPGAGAHPDCIQLRTVNQAARQSDIWLLNNLAVGRMQAFFGGDYRVHYIGNYAATNGFTHTVTASACRYCRAFDNVLSNTQDAPHGPGSLKGFTDLSNSTGRNLLWDARIKGPAPRRWSFEIPPIAGLVGSQFDDRSFNPAAVEVAR